MAARLPSRSRRAVLFTVLCCILLSGGCASFKPLPLEQVPFTGRALTKTDGSVRVTVAVPSPGETRKLFGVDLAGKEIQPVWIEVENGADVPYWLVPLHLDPRYFSPREAAYRSRFRFGGERNRKMEEHFSKLMFTDFIAPRSTVSGFVYTNLDRGSKFVQITLLGPRTYKVFTVLVPVPNMQADYERVDFEKLYGQEEFQRLDEDGLRRALEGMPCCTTNEDGSRFGDPLNLVFIGSGEDILASLRSSRWDETEVLYMGSALKTTSSFLFGTKYRYSPVSPLYVYGRSQDAAFQKARENVDERIHLRVWLMPKTFEGKPVWIGQISRDIGVKFTLKTGFLTTHVIDPDVDGDRWYLVQDLVNAERVAKLGFVKGVGRVLAADPRMNLGGDPYFTDGFRAVILLSNEPVAYDEIDFFDWELMSHESTQNNGVR